MDPDRTAGPRPAPTVTTVGEGVVTGVPDTLRLHVSVGHRSASVSDALAGCASGLESVVTVARRFTDADRIASRSLSVHQGYDADGSPSGYQARHAVEVVCSDIARAGELIEAVAEGVGDRLQIDQVEMFVGDPAEMTVRARELAFADARAKADALAALAGQAVEGALTVVEGVGGPPRPLGAEAATARVGTSFEPGTASVGASVTVTWATAYV